MTPKSKEDNGVSPKVSTDSIQEKYMEEARGIADPAQNWSYVQWAVFLSARDERVRAEAKAEAFTEASIEAGGIGQPALSGWLAHRAVLLRAGMGEE